jgi:cathepsin X
MGFFKVELGKNLLMIESNVAWATPGTFSTVNYPCPKQDGGGDVNSCLAHYEYVDPSHDLAAVQRRLQGK